LADFSAGPLNPADLTAVEPSITTKKNKERY
jgi:hypothetical protein